MKAAQIVSKHRRVRESRNKHLIPTTTRGIFMTFSCFNHHQGPVSSLLYLFHLALDVSNGHWRNVTRCWPLRWKCSVLISFLLPALLSVCVRDALGSWQQQQHPHIIRHQVPFTRRFAIMRLAVESCDHLLIVIFLSFSIEE